MSVRYMMASPLNCATRLRLDAVQPTMSMPSAIGIMASNHFRKSSCTSPAFRTVATSDSMNSLPTESSDTSTVAIANDGIDNHVAGSPDNFDALISTTSVGSTNVMSHSGIIYRVAQSALKKMGMNVSTIGTLGLSNAKSALLALLALVPSQGKRREVSNSDEAVGLQEPVVSTFVVAETADQEETVDELAAEEIAQDNLQEIIRQVVEVKSDTEHQAVQAATTEETVAEGDDTIEIHSNEAATNPPTTTFSWFLTDLPPFIGNGVCTPPAGEFTSTAAPHVPNQSSFSCTIPSFAAGSECASSTKKPTATGTAIRDLPTQLPSSDFTFVGPTVERQLQQDHGSEEIDSWGNGRFSPMFFASESSMSSPVVGEKISEESEVQETQSYDDKTQEMTEGETKKEDGGQEKEKKSGKKSHSKTKKQPTNKAAVWGKGKSKKL